MQHILLAVLSNSYRKDRRWHQCENESRTRSNLSSFCNSANSLTSYHLINLLPSTEKKKGVCENYGDRGDSADERDDKRRRIHFRVPYQNFPTFKVRPGGIPRGVRACLISQVDTRECKGRVGWTLMDARQNFWKGSSAFPHNWKFILTGNLGRYPIIVFIRKLGLSKNLKRVLNWHWCGFQVL